MYTAGTSIKTIAGQNKLSGETSNIFSIANFTKKYKNEFNNKTLINPRFFMIYNCRLITIILTIIINIYLSSISKAAPTGVINDLLDIQLNAIDENFSAVIKKIDRDFKYHVQNSFEVTEGIPSNIFSDRSRALNNTDALIKMVDRVYNNLGDYGHFTSSLSQIKGAIEKVKNTKNLLEDLSALKISKDRLTKASQELLSLLNSQTVNTSIWSALHQKDPHLLKKAINSKELRHLRFVLDKMTGSNLELNNSSSNLFENFIGLTQAHYLLHMDLSSEAGKKLYIQNYIIKKYIESSVITPGTDEGLHLIKIYTPHYEGFLFKKPTLEKYSNLQDGYNLIGWSEALDIEYSPPQRDDNDLSDDFKNDIIDDAREKKEDSNENWLGSVTGLHQSPASIFSITTFGYTESALLHPNVNDVISIEVLDPTSNTGQRLGTVQGRINGKYDHTAWGEWNGKLIAVNHGTGQPTEFERGLFVVGSPTPKSDIDRRIGNAEFTGQIHGDYASQADGLIANSVTGTIDLTVNFDNDSVSGIIGMLGPNGFSANPQFNANFYDKGPNAVGYNGNLIGANGNGGIDGTFFGKNGEETGGSFHYFKNTGENGTGIFIAKEKK